jgi:cytochrome c5
VKYHGNNPVGLALAADRRGEARAALLRTLSEFQAAARRRNASASLPAIYQHNLAAAECAARCAEVVKEFHAVCHGTSLPEQGG